MSESDVEFLSLLTAIIFAGKTSGNPNLANNMNLDEFREEHIEYSLVAAQTIMKKVKDLNKGEQK